MVHVFAEPLFPLLLPELGAADVLGTLAPTLACGSGLIENAPSFGIAGSCRFEIVPGVLFSVRVGRDVDDAEVHTDEIGRGDRCPFRDLHRHQQEPLRSLARITYPIYCLGRIE